MLFSITMICLALCLYSLAIWSEKLKRSLAPWMIRVFALGFACDVLGTSIMFARSQGGPISLHVCCGYAALAIMGLHLAWALAAAKKGGQAARLFSRFSVYAWCIWLSAFVTGIPR